MKLTIDWSTESTTSTGKTYKKVTAKDEQGNEIGASVWSDAPFYAEVAPGATIEAEVKKSADGKYINLVGPSQPRTQASTYKTGQIKEAMETKARHIHEAQDRSAWMWAKNNSALLIANNDQYKNLPASELLEALTDMATNIYNAEPNKPF